MTTQAMTQQIAEYFKTQPVLKAWLFGSFTRGEQTVLTHTQAYCMEEKILMDLLNQSMQDSAREARLLLGRPSSHATREEALKQVAMLKAAKESALQICK